MKTKLIQKLFFIPLFSLIAIILSANVSLAYMDYSDYPPNFWPQSFTIVHDYEGELEYADDEVMRPLQTPYDLSSKVRPRDGYEVSGYDPASIITEHNIKDTLTIRYKKKAAPPPPPPPQNNDNNNNPPPQNGGKKDSYIYIYYGSVGGHDVLASQTVQGSDGETLNLNDYVKDVTTMTHVGFNPSSATLTFDKKRRGMGVILYEKNQKLNKDNNNNNQGNNNGYNNQGNNNYYNNPNNNQYNNDNNQYNQYNNDNNQNNNGYTNSGKKDSYIYIYYRSVAGHDVLASQTVQGSDGETLNLNDYVKDVTTMTHVGFNPSSATLTFNKKKRGSGVILYEKNQKLNKQTNSNKGNKSTVGSQTGKIGNTVINTQNNNVIISSPKLKKGNVRYVKSVNGYVYPNKLLTRAELAGYISNIINESYWDDADFTVEDFDVVDVVGNATNIEDIVAAYLIGAMPAKQGNLFKPNAVVTKGDLAIAVASLIDTSKDSHSQAEAIKMVTSKKIMSVEKSGSFEPNKTLTRGQVIVILNKLVGNKNAQKANVQLNDVNSSAWYYKDIQAAVQ